MMMTTAGISLFNASLCMQSQWGKAAQLTRLTSVYNVQPFRLRSALQPLPLVFNSRLGREKSAAVVSCLAPMPLCTGQHWVCTIVMPCFGKLSAVILVSNLFGDMESCVSGERGWLSEFKRDELFTAPTGKLQTGSGQSYKERGVD